MINTKPSMPFRNMYRNTVDELIHEACSASLNYSVKPQINGKSTYITIWEEYEKYRNQMLQNVKSKRLDRHKIASCLCGAVLEVQPLTECKNKKIKKNANEILALHSGIAVIKYFMIYEYINKLSLSNDEKIKMRDYLKENFFIQFPHSKENICDIQEYSKNIVNALFWSRFTCELLNKQCFKYEPWAYATIFYHIEAYNKQSFLKVLSDYKTKYTQ